MAARSSEGIGRTSRTTRLESRRKYANPLRCFRRDPGAVARPTGRSPLSASGSDLAPRIEERRRVGVEVELALADQRLVAARDDHHRVRAGHRDGLLELDLALRVRAAPREHLIVEPVDVDVVRLDAGLAGPSRARRGPAPRSRRRAPSSRSARPRPAPRRRDGCSSTSVWPSRGVQPAAAIASRSLAVDERAHEADLRGLDHAARRRSSACGTPTAMPTSRP